MADAYYHRGLTIELDAALPRLTIEGRELPTEQLAGIFALLKSQSVNADELRRCCEEIIERSPEFQKRESTQQAHLAILKRGVPEWNRWRRDNPEIRPLLYDCDLTKEALHVELNGADFANAVLINANLRGQKLKGANFHEANLGKAKLHNADLTGVNFCRTDLYETELPDAILNNANLQGTQLAKTNFERAHLIGCKVYGMSAWDLKLDGAEQRDLIIRYRQKRDDENSEDGTEVEMTVDDLQLAQFIYLLLNNQNIRTVIDTITSKVVLILGRFADERKKVLDAIRTALPQRDLTPVVFDFAIPANRDVTETVRILAGLALFVVADITEATEVRAELHNIVPEFTTLPIQPLVLAENREFVSLPGHLTRYPWVLPTFEYQNLDHLLANLNNAVIEPAMAQQRALIKQYGSQRQA